ncbi:MAG: 50S ribosomal protein L22 [Candidatus Omnitrophica bacterium]|jgi:large subunit ribosomal protein L22|nr:50S ribosomal protein L22 [Candidatus Omnitrophota bacterium]MDD5080740.1 50S ribosomal protein L22 [Candidatus Omnitrophota bacterium]MDD5441252.1 50S ribosomal protein L22 [Candidatus Omnitrophota bacterium]
MVARAESKYMRISPTKVRPVVALIKGANVMSADVNLSMMTKKGAAMIRQVLKSAVANAKVKGYREESLFISKLLINSGPMLKRWRAATFGRATSIRKRMSHIVVELDSKDAVIVQQPNKEKKR